MDGVLIGSPNDTPIPIEQYEYETLRDVLSAMRAPRENINVNYTVVQNVLLCIRPMIERTARQQAAGISSAIIEAVSEIEGVMLMPGFLSDGATVEFFRDAAQFESLMAFAAMLRQGGWFAVWVAAHAELYRKTGKYPTPLEAMRSLVNDAQQFDADLDAARRMVRSHPELVEQKQTA